MIIKLKNGQTLKIYKRDEHTVVLSEVNRDGFPIWSLELEFKDVEALATEFDFQVRTW